MVSYLWTWYIDYLWNYDSNSWVATIAYAFRIWAILAILPTLVLGLLDVTSYVIARTLGDPTASTSHKSSFPTQPPPKFELKIDDASPPPATSATPVIPIEISPPQDKERHSPSDISPPKPPVPARPCVPGAGEASSTTTSTSDSSLSAFFVDGEVSEDDGAARLAGVGVFSPVASMPGSPVVSRRNLLEREGDDDGGSGSSDESGSLSSAARGGVLLRSRDRDRDDCELGHERTAWAEGGAIGGGESTSGESSFALLDREESFEDAGAHIRRRVQGTTGADDDNDDA